MTRFLVLFLVLLFSSVCLAQNSITNGEPQIQGPMRVFGNIIQNIRGTEGKQVSETTGTTSLYVETTGSDSNDCKSVSRPCLTIQSAVDRVPKFVKHNTTITVGAGNFAGFCASGFSVDLPATYTITGTLGSPTLTTGTTSGTATGGSTYQCIDAGQTWTVNELRGRLLLINGVYRVIRNNTVDTINLVGPFSATCSGKVYSILEQKTIINTDGINYPAARIYIGSFLVGRRDRFVVSDFAVLGGGYAFFVNDTVGGLYRRIKVDTPTISGILLQVNMEPTIEDCWVTGSPGHGFNLISVGFARINRSYAYNNKWGISVQQANTLTGSDLIAELNSLDDNAGLFLQECVYVSLTTITTEFITGINGVGVRIVGGAYTLLSGVTTRSNTIGMLLDCISSFCDISSPTIESNTLDGLRVLGSGGWIDIDGGSFSSNGGYGISLNGGISHGSPVNTFGGSLDMVGTITIQNNTLGGVSIDNGYCRMTDVDGTNTGYGLIVGNNGVVKITTNTGLTGTTGDATINGGVNLLTWITHFANNLDSVINTSSGSSITRKD